MMNDTSYGYPTSNEKGNLVGMECRLKPDTSTLIFTVQREYIRIHMELLIMSTSIVHK